MKRRISMGLFITLLFFSVTHNIFAAHIAPVRVMQVPYASQYMVIDGVDNEPSYSVLQTTDAFNPTGSTGADADYTMTFRICYDENYLYVYAKILDDYENDWEWGGSNQWEFDCVELFMDLDTNGSGVSVAYDDNTYQIRFNRGIDSVGDNYGRDCLRSDHKYYWENTADGWLFEAALSWKFVLGSGQEPEDIMQYFQPGMISGFDLMGSDSDTDGAGGRDCQTAWDNDEPQYATDRTEDNAWNNRRVFGIIQFQTGDIQPEVSPYITPIMKMNIPARTDLINIDGFDSENSYSAAQSLSVFNSQGVINSNDLSGSFKATYDAQYLYFYSRVNDNVVNSWPGGNTSQDLYDNLELYIDLDTNQKSSQYDENTQMFRFHRGVNVLNNYGNATMGEFTIYNNNVSGNSAWVVEAAIPWTAIIPAWMDPESITNYAKLSFGFDVLVNDSDDDIPNQGSIDGQLAWDLDDPDLTGYAEESADNNIFAFGIAKLTGTMLPGPSQPSTEGYYPPVTISVIPATISGPVIINGIRDDHDWSPPVSLSLFNSNGYDGIKDISATLSYCWSSKYLYIYADIMDNSALIWKGNGDVLDYDNLEVFIDLETLNTGSAYGPNTSRLVFNRGLNSIANPLRAAKSDFEVYAGNKNNGSGWIIEAAIPWISVLPEGSAPDAIRSYSSKFIGFDVHVNDCDGTVSNDLRPDKQMALDLDNIGGSFNLDENRAAYDRFAFGLADLSGDPFTVSITNNRESNFKIFPNPAIGSIRIAGLISGDEIEIITFLGQSIMSKKVESETEIVDISDINSGIYLVRIVSDNKQAEILKFIKE